MITFGTGGRNGSERVDDLIGIGKQDRCLRQYPTPNDIGDYLTARLKAILIRNSGISNFDNMSFSAKA